MLRYGIVSDTHGVLHKKVYEHFEHVEAILHVGDVGSDDVLTELEVICPEVYAIAGNVDMTSARLPGVRVVELPFGNVGMAHGHLFPTEKTERVQALYNTFQEADVRVILFGHSHQQYLDAYRGVWFLNPGSAGRPRFSVVPSTCLLQWDQDHDLLSFSFQTFSWS